MHSKNGSNTKCAERIARFLDAADRGAMHVIGKMLEESMEPDATGPAHGGRTALMLACGAGHEVREALGGGMEGRGGRSWDMNLEGKEGGKRERDSPPSLPPPHT
jgi:hypothetical protein